MQHLDPRIGVLNSGVYYAFVDGYDKPETRGTLEEVEIALGLRAAKPTPTKRIVAAQPAVKSYSVHMRFEYPGWSYVDGITYEGMLGRTKAEAIRNARAEAFADGHLGVGQGRVWFKATEEDA
ncbi:hypothetical protein CcrMagneto_gp279 [Caulobacter virus Magneto]|uniref:hypothetical protein n=1 Tax=Caulobacter virus Magneto TaxID=1211642 RepID=UPI00028B05DA|nr:hypothetical protein CcrMagneto_gp279 [Caulobacter virus Magneto]AFU87449.1 hypothetical protein CcrMagneto_gp279 [Caulobacter virus Magneto]